MKSLTPAQQVIKVVRDELQTTMGGKQVRSSSREPEPAVMMMAGVQGSGKTTASAKLAKMYAVEGADGRCWSPRTCGVRPPSSS